MASLSSPSIMPGSSFPHLSDQSVPPVPVDAASALPRLSCPAADGISLTGSEPPPPPYADSHAVPPGMVTRLPPVHYHEQDAFLLADRPLVAASAQSASISPATAAAAPNINEQVYAEAITRACTRLGGLMDAAERGSRSGSVALQDVFVAQDVRLLDDSSLASDSEAEWVEQLRRSKHLEPLAPDVHLHAPAVFVSGRHGRSVMNVLGDASLRWVVILGSPGSGKSSALRAHLLAWAAASPAERERLDFPVLVELKKYARDRHPGSTLLQYMSGGGEAHLRLGVKALKAMLQPSSGRRVLLLLDGLDEVFDVRLRAQVVEDVQRFVNEHRSAAVRVVLTSRIVGYSVTELQADDFTHHVMQPLDSDQIVDFVRRWHAAVYMGAEAATRKSREAHLAKALSETGLRQLASSPLLLGMICLVNHSSELPTRRASLYEACSRLLLERWKTDEAVQAVRDTAGMGITLFTRAHKEALLADLAWRMQQDGKLPLTSSQGFIASWYSGFLSLWQQQQAAAPLANLVPQPVLEAVVLEHVRRQGLRQAEPALVQQALITQLRERHHVICWLGAQSFAFVHRTFLEYYAALYVRQQWEAGRMSQWQLVQLFQQQKRASGWREVLLLLSEMLPSERVYPCLRVLAEEKHDPKDPLPPDDLVRQSRARYQVESVLSLAACCLAQLQRRDKAAAAERLIRQRLEAAVQQGDSSLHSELAQVWPDDRTRALLEAAALRDRSARAVVIVLAARWADDRTRAVLEQVARYTKGNGSLYDVGSVQAVHELSWRWKDSQTQAGLERIATSAAHWMAAAHALRVLERDWGCSLEAMQTAAYWRDRGVVEGAEADVRVREIVRRAGGVTELKKAVWGAGSWAVRRDGDGAVCSL